MASAHEMGRYKVQNVPIETNQQSAPPANGQLNPNASVFNPSAAPFTPGQSPAVVISQPKKDLVAENLKKLD